MDELSVSVVDAGLLQDLRDQFDQVIGSVRSARFFTSVPADMAESTPAIGTSNVPCLRNTSGQLVAVYLLDDLI